MEPHPPHTDQPSETWSIRIHKDYLKFSAAHFLIFPDGTAERLHGHNYKVYVEVHGALDAHGLVMNFKEIKPMVKELVDELDEHLLIPGRHAELRAVAGADGITTIRYRQRRYTVPSDEVVVLPINNSSAENLAAYVGGELLARLRARFPAISPDALEVGVEETPGQIGTYRWRAPR
jgi:6-pyruvoyltetrahydropterin/6-carboxytetrahydropterin synthase